MSGKGTVVMLVEDEPSVLRVSCTLLIRLGSTVLSAGSLAEALKMASEYTSDLHLLVTDMVMPEMSGKELYSRLLQSRPWLKCLYVSGYADGLGDSAGIVDDGTVLLEKPYTLRSLANKLSEAMVSEHQGMRARQPRE